MSQRDEFATTWTILRVAAAIHALPATIFAARVLYASIFNGLDIFGIGMLGAAGCAAILGWWFVLGGGNPVSRTLFFHAFVGGLIVGGICFAIGFFGPMITSPESNQGPLAGIFITGPIGFVIGTVCGAVVGLFRVHPQTSHEKATASSGMMR